MAKTIYLCGHGGWKPEDGYFTLPKGCSISFIVHPSKCLYTPDMFRVCEGTWPNPPFDTIMEYKSCPNMTWGVDLVWKKKKCQDKLDLNPHHGAGNPAIAIFPSKTKTLKEFFTQSMLYLRSDITLHGHLAFIWNCCTALTLKPTERGGKIGVNAAEAFDQYDYVDFTGPKLRVVGHGTK